MIVSREALSLVASEGDLIYGVTAGSGLCASSWYGYRERNTKPKAPRQCTNAALDIVDIT